jgi:hypothetical protein
MNIEQLRSMMAEQMMLLRDGKSDPKNVNAMVNAAGTIIRSVRLEMEYAKLLNVQPSIKFVTDKSAVKQVTQKGK